MQVHVRLRRCFIPTGSCNCAVVVRENNNILGINACQLDRPPILVKYLVDPLQPADDIHISADGLTYIVGLPVIVVVIIIIIIIISTFNLGKGGTYPVELRRGAHLPDVGRSAGRWIDH